MIANIAASCCAHCRETAAFSALMQTCPAPRFKKPRAAVVPPPVAPPLTLPGNAGQIGRILREGRYSPAREQSAKPDRGTVPPVRPNCLTGIAVRIRSRYDWLYGKSPVATRSVTGRFGSFPLPDISANCPSQLWTSVFKHLPGRSERQGSSDCCQRSDRHEWSNDYFQRIITSVCPRRRE